MLNVGKIQPGETLVVSGAAGAVGSVVCQIGKLKGARVIAIAGTAGKCAWLEELGVDKVLNYKDDNFHAKCSEVLEQITGGGVEAGWDVFFDNVGGDILDFMLTKMRRGARVVLCGKQMTLLSLFNVLNTNEHVRNEGSISKYSKFSTRFVITAVPLN